MSRLTRALVVVCVVALLLPTVPGVLAAGPYGLDSPNAVDVPNQVVRGAGEFLTVREIARVPRGEPFVVEATAPAGAAYGVELRNMHGMTVDVSNRTLRGNDSTAFETGYLRPGSYVAVLYDRGEARAALPVVIEGYGVATEVPDSAEAGTDVTVVANLTAASGAPTLERVEVVVVDRSTKEAVVQRTMTADGDGYAATIRLDEPGEYGLGVNVRGERSVEGYDEILGFGDAHTLSVTAPESSTTGSAATGATEATTTRTTSATASTTVPEGVITRNPTDGPSTPVEDSPATLLSVVFTLLLAAGLGLILWSRG